MSFSSSGVLTATGVDVFLGQGPALSSTSPRTINPAARGLLISGANVGAIRVGVGPSYTYAVAANGTVRCSASRE